MKIEFGKIEEAPLEHFKGGEGRFLAKMYFDGTTRIMKGRLEPGCSIGLHRHEGNCEVMFITSGKGYVLYDGERIDLEAGDAHFCPEGHEHTLVNDSDGILAFSAVVPKQ